MCHHSPSPSLRTTGKSKQTYSIRLSPRRARPDPWQAWAVAKGPGLGGPRWRLFSMLYGLEKNLVSRPTLETKYVRLLPRRIESPDQPLRPISIASRAEESPRAYRIASRGCALASPVASPADPGRGCAGRSLPVFPPCVRLARPSCPSGLFVSPQLIPG
jgi:hypothetical protein